MSCRDSIFLDIRDMLKVFKLKAYMEKPSLKWQLSPWTIDITVDSFFQMKSDIQLTMEVNLLDQISAITRHSRIMLPMSSTEDNVKMKLKDSNSSKLSKNKRILCFYFYANPHTNQLWKLMSTQEISLPQIYLI